MFTILMPEFTVYLEYQTVTVLQYSLRKGDTMKYAKAVAASMTLLMALTACGTQAELVSTPEVQKKSVEILLSDDGVQVDGAPAGTDQTDAVYTANDIVYYESGKDFTYGEGTQADAHSAEDAAAHTVVHITQPGTYSLSGSLSRGQIAVDLGEEAKENPDAVVTLILNGADISCDVAPAVIFYNVYECGSDDVDTASKDVDTSAAGANVVIADGTENTVNGSYVARIYKADSVVLSSDGTHVEDAKKLHKYDGAFYSKQSMNISGGEEKTGVLNIHAENEGLDSELHLTINGGNINIYSGNDGINTNEDGVSVTTVNGGSLNIQVTGDTGEGDGIDSNGWLVINGGTVTASACSDSMDAGIDSDMGIHINGGTVAASGHMLDRIEAGGQTYAVFTFNQKQKGTDVLSMKNEDSSTLLELCPQNDYSILIYSSPDITPGTYTLWSNDQQLAGQSGGTPGSGMTPPERIPPFDGMEPPEGKFPFDGMTPPEDIIPPEKPDRTAGGNRPPNDRLDADRTEIVQDLLPEFQITEGSNLFGAIALLE